MARIILLDLNFTLVANSRELGYPFYNHIHREEYRVDLWQRVKEEYVILITVRPVEYRELTLARIQAKLSWQPQEAYFNQWRLKAPESKAKNLDLFVFPLYGGAPEQYFAIESNAETRAMYAARGIAAQHYRDFIAGRPI